MTPVLEALYRLDLEFEPWSRNVAEALREVLDQDQLGVLGALYDCPDPCSMTMGRRVHHEVPDQLLNLFERGAHALPPEYVADKYLGRSYSFAASLRGWAEIPPVRDGTVFAHGIADLLTLSTTEPDGAGCAFFSFRSERRPVSVHDHIELARLGRHLAAAHSLRRRLTSDVPATSFAEAILDGSGRVHHACREARSKPSRAALSRAVLQMERARTRVAHNPDTPTASVQDRWTLVDYVERDGRRYVVAVENNEQRAPIDLLSKRERDVVRCGLRGHHPKAIAYELGISYSTVRVLIARIVQKTKTRSWKEVVASAAENSFSEKTS
jgi:DNA-binding CsgD family transcriptional regulator